MTNKRSINDSAISLLTDAGMRFNANQGMRDAAAIAYYAAFSLPPLLIISMAVLGFFYEANEASGQLDAQLEQLAGEVAADQFEEIIETASESNEGYTASLLGIVMLFVGATGVLVQLQSTLNTVWGVETAPSEGSWMSIVVKRIISLGMILVIAFLLIVSIAVRTAVTGIGDNMDAMLPDFLSSNLLLIINQSVSFLILTLLLAAMFRFLPDAKIPWRSVWFGSIATTVLFTLGKFTLGIYLTFANPGTIYGAAGSLAIILLWVYYASIILIFGAELTYARQAALGERVEPEKFAEKAEDTHPT